jgi:hypothetical protein
VSLNAPAVSTAALALREPRLALVSRACGMVTKHYALGNWVAAISGGVLFWWLNATYGHSEPWLDAWTAVVVTLVVGGLGRLYLYPLTQRPAQDSKRERGQGDNGRNA